MYNSYIIARNVLLESLRKKDFYVFLIFLLVLAVYLANANFFDITGISRYLKEISLELTYLFSLIITITFSAKLLPAELESKTIYPLLAKPVSRGQVVTGKFIGACFVSILCFSIFYFLVGIITSIKGEGFAYDMYLQGYLLWVLGLALIASMVVFISLHLTVSANITLSFCIYFLMSWFGPHLKEMALVSQQTSNIMLSILYYLLPHFEFYDMRTRLVHMWDPIPAFIIISLIIYTSLYVALFISLAAISFKKKVL